MRRHNQQNVLGGRGKLPQKGLARKQVKAAESGTGGWGSTPDRKPQPQKTSPSGDLALGSLALRSPRKASSTQVKAEEVGLAGEELVEEGLLLLCRASVRHMGRRKIGQE